MQISLSELVTEVAELCRETGLNQAELALRAGIKPETLGKILGGHQTTSPVVVSSLRNAARVVLLEKKSGTFTSGTLKEDATEYKVGRGMDAMDLMLAAIEVEARERAIPFDRESFLHTLIGLARDQKKFEVASEAAAKLSQIFREKKTNSGPPPGLVRGVARALNKKIAHAGEGSSPSDEAGGSNAPSPQQPDRTGPPSSDRQKIPERAQESRGAGKASGHHKK